MKDDSPEQVEGLPQIPSSPTKATLRRDMREEIPLLLPMAEQLGFHIPAPTLADQGRGQQGRALSLMSASPTASKKVANIICNRVAFGIAAVGATYPVMVTDRWE